MTRKGSMMGTSKYEFCPEQLDADIQERKANRVNLESDFERILRNLIEEDAFNKKERYYLVIEILRKIREDYI